eukprot:Clim_evm34s225 gene=Clim_evmTU34s225
MADPNKDTDSPVERSDLHAKLARSKPQKFNSWYEFFTTYDVERIPCARDSYLYGIGGGSMLGTWRFLQTRNVLQGCNWAIGSFIVISFASWEICRYRLSAEQEQIKKVLQDQGLEASKHN